MLLTLLLVGGILWFYAVSSSFGGSRGPAMGQPVVGNEFSFERRGEEYLSPGFDSAENRVELNIRGGIGKVEVR